MAGETAGGLRGDVPRGRRGRSNWPSTRSSRASPVGAVHEIARNHLVRGGFPADLPHSLGHSLGLGIHQRPSFSAVETEAIEVGNVITVEPGVPGRKAKQNQNKQTNKQKEENRNKQTDKRTSQNGQTNENIIVVTPNGCEVLSAQERALQVR